MLYKRVRGCLTIRAIVFGLSSWLSYSFQYISIFPPACENPEISYLKCVEIGYNDQFITGIGIPMRPPDFSKPTFYFELPN